VSAELVEWADLIFVMERAHRNKLSKRFKPNLKKARVICLSTSPHEFEFMDPVLVRLLQNPRHSSPTTDVERSSRKRHLRSMKSAAVDVKTASPGPG
jgi:predicted protein tyrosine phosphatase